MFNAGQCHADYYAHRSLTVVEHKYLMEGHIYSFIKMDSSHCLIEAWKEFLMFPLTTWSASSGGQQFEAKYLDRTFFKEFMD